MNRAIFAKALRDYALLIGLVAAAIVVFQLIIVRFVLVEAARDLELLRTWIDLPLVRSLMSLVLGGDLAGGITPTALATIGVAHPFVWTVSWALLLAVGSGVIAGEIGRGTADLLLTLPVSRGRIYASTSLVWLLATLPISFAPPAGLWLGMHVFHSDEPLQYGRLWLVAINLWALNVCVGAATMCVSALLSRRGLAIAIVLAALLISDVINLISHFVEQARWINFLGFLHYFRPLPIVRTGALPWANLAALLLIAAAAWLIGRRHFVRRDIPAA